MTATAQRSSFFGRPVGQSRTSADCIPTAARPLAASPGARLPDPVDWIGGNGEQPSFPRVGNSEQVFPRVGSFWSGPEGLALIDHVSMCALVDFYFQGVVETLPLPAFLKRFPRESKI